MFGRGHIRSANPRCKRKPIETRPRRDGSGHVLFLPLGCCLLHDHPPFRGREWLVSNSPFLPSSTVVCLPSGESPADKHRVPNPIVLVGSTTYGETVSNDDDTHGTENAAFARFPRGLGRGKDRPRAPLVVKVTTGLWVGSGWRTWTCGHTHVACARRLKSMHGEAAAKMAALGRPRS